MISRYRRAIKFTRVGTRLRFNRIGIQNVEKYYNNIGVIVTMVIIISHKTSQWNNIYV